MLLLFVFLPLIWLRASPESSLWIDEIHSLQLTQLPLERLLDEVAADFHPPGYPLALKAWLKVGRLAGLEPGVAWARALNVVVWVLVVVIGWLIGGAVWGRVGGVLVPLCVATSAAGGVVVADLRGYAFAWGACCVAVLLLTSLMSCGHTYGKQKGLWVAYGLTLTAALWSHLLVIPIVLLLSLTWLTLDLAGWGHGSRSRRSWGVAAHLLPWLLYLPWLARLPEQFSNLQQAAPEWMTPATLGNLIRVFTWWLPLGRLGEPSSALAFWLSASAALGILAPTAIGARAWRARGSRREATTLALLGLPTAFGSVVFFWLMARIGLAPMFHGPRYPILVGGVLAVGLAGAALSVSGRVWKVVLVLTPWLVTGIGGQILALRQGSSAGGLEAFRPRIEQVAGAEHRSLHVMPSELIPFVRRTLADFVLEPAETLVCQPPDRALVLDVNPWSGLDRTRDQVLVHTLVSGLLAARVERHEWQDLQTTAVLYQVAGFFPEQARSLCATGLAPRATAPGNAVSVALPENQLAASGLSFLELDDSLKARRWGTRPEVRIRFDREVPAGDYRLHLKGARQPYPEATVAVELEMEGIAGSIERVLGPGPIDILWSVTLVDARRPVLRVRHPVWSPAQALGSTDTRRLTFLFSGAWLEAARDTSETLATDQSWLAARDDWGI